MTTVFWDAYGIIYIDYLPSKQMINDDYYAALLDCFNTISKKQCPHLAKKKVLFHQNNARVHMCLAMMAKFNEFHYELLPSSIFARFSPATVSKLEEMIRRKESSSSSKQRLILKGWTNHIIRTA